MAIGREMIGNHDVDGFSIAVTSTESVYRSLARSVREGELVAEPSRDVASEPMVLSRATNWVSVMLSRMVAIASRTSVIDRRTWQVAGSAQSSQVSNAVRLAQRIGASGPSRHE